MEKATDNTDLDPIEYARGRSGYHGKHPFLLSFSADRAWAQSGDFVQAPVDERENVENNLIITFETNPVLKENRGAS